MLRFGRKKQVFIDWELVEPGYGVAWTGDAPGAWEMPTGVALATHLPEVGTEPMVQADRPWESWLNVYSSIFEDEGRYRLYYECHYDDGTDQDDYGAMLAYTESTDGINWTKPSVGTVEFAGSKDNNLVFGLDRSLGRGAHGATVFKDPSAPPDQRYKLVHMGKDKGVDSVYGAVSPDGLRWTALQEPVVPGYFSDTQTVARFDEDLGRYVGYFRGWTQHERGRAHGRRTIARGESDRFDAWQDPVQVVAPDIHDAPDTDIYTNSYSPWPDADAHLLFPAYYQRTRDICEIHMLTSRDGHHWQRPIRDPVVPAGPPGSDSEGSYYAGAGLVSMRPGQVSLPVGPVWHTHNEQHHDSSDPERHTGYLVQATWRRDGFASLEAESAGSFTTVPFTFEGGSLQVNAWTRFGGELSVELVDASTATMKEAGTTVAGKTFADCDAITGDHLETTISWGGDSDLSAWAGKQVRLRFRMRRARLYALQFV